MRTVRKDVARILTVLRDREIAEAEALARRRQRWRTSRSSPAARREVEEARAQRDQRRAPKAAEAEVEADEAAEDDDAADEADDEAEEES